MNRSTLLTEEAVPPGSACPLIAGSVVPSGTPGYYQISALSLSGTSVASVPNTVPLRDGEGGFEVAYLQVDTTPTVTPQTGAPGKLIWNDTAGTLEFQLKGGNVTLQVGQEQVLRATNLEVTPLVDGEVVYIFGSSGIHNTVKRADAGLESTSALTIGVVTEPIAAHPGEGYITTFGSVTCDTNHLVEGQAVWLSTVAGATTSAQPTAPDHAVLIGYCVKKAGAGAGRLFVHVQNGYELDKLHDVLITSPVNGNFLQYDGTKWINGTALTSGRIPFVTTNGRLADASTWTRNPVTGQVIQTYNGTTASVYQLVNTNPSASAQAYTQYTVDAGSWYFGAESNAGGLSPGGGFIYTGLNKPFRLYIGGVNRLELSSAGVLTSNAPGNIFNFYGKFGAATVGLNTLLAVGSVAGNFGGSTAAAHFTDHSVNATVNFQNTRTDGYTAFDFFGDTNIKSASFAWSNSTAAFLPGALWIMTRVAGDMVLGTNTTEVLRIRNATKNAEIATGNLVLPKTSGVGLKVDPAAPTFPWKDNLGVSVTRSTGVGSPTWAPITGSIYGWKMVNGDAFQVLFHMTHDLVQGSDQYIHSHWEHNGTAISGSLIIRYIYRYGRTDLPFTAEKTITQTVSTPNIATKPAYCNFIEEVQFSSLAGSATLAVSPDIYPDTIVQVRIIVDQIPTITGGDFFLHITDLHYQSLYGGTKQKNDVGTGLYV